MFSPGSLPPNNLLDPNVRRRCSQMLIEQSDPALLFTPVKAGPRRSESSELSDPPDSPSPDTGAATRTDRGKDVTLFVELPSLTNEERSKYDTLNWQDSDSDSDDVDEIIELVGEHKSGNKVYLFARHGDGIVRRVGLILLLLSPVLRRGLERGMGIQD